VSDSSERGTSERDKRTTNTVERVLSDPGFGDDPGAPDSGLDSALLTWQRDDGPPGPVLTALLTARVLVPIVAMLAEREADGREKTTDMAVVTLRGTDGRVALPAFSSLDRLASWHPQARPLPITAPRAAQAALFENADLLRGGPCGRWRTTGFRCRPPRTPRSRPCCASG
jgi:hypothetical protein